MIWRIELWRLFVSLACFGAVFGLLRYTSVIVDRYGVGLFPILCIVAALFLFAAGTGVMFRRARVFMAELAMWLFEIFFFWI